MSNLRDALRTDGKMRKEWHEIVEKIPAEGGRSEEERMENEIDPIGSVLLIKFLEET